MQRRFASEVRHVKRARWERQECHSIAVLYTDHARPFKGLPGAALKGEKPAIEIKNRMGE